MASQQRFDREDPASGERHGSEIAEGSGPESAADHVAASAMEEETPGRADFTITVYSDPGRTSWMVRELLSADRDDEEETAHWAHSAAVRHKQVLIPLREDGTLDLHEAKAWARQDAADITVVITEIPRMEGSDPRVAELNFTDKLAVISMPTLGPIFAKRSLRRELGRSVDALVFESPEEAHSRGGFNSRVEELSDDVVYLTPRRSFPSRIWSTLGMVAANEPLWSMPKLSGVFAASAATGAFGIFFNSIWQMADFLPVWRLAVVMGIAIIVVTGWLILANRMWDRPSSVGGAKLAAMYNTSTVLTLVVSVASLYAILFAGILIVALLLIDPEFMRQEVGSGDFTAYLDIAWLSASMGTVAGAIGSNFDESADVENLTQGSRELKRYPRDEAQR